MITLSPPQKAIQAQLHLAGSKSISNRVLILQALFETSFNIQNLSDSEDTQLLVQAIHQIKNHSHQLINVHHAGTDMRFLTALLSVSKGRFEITGSMRMKQRPIGILVEALRAIGAKIEYSEKENYPPLIISGSDLSGGTLTINSSVSSQYISALLLIAPKLKNGLEINLSGYTVSESYISMTIAILKEFGCSVEQSDSLIKVFPSEFHKVPKSFTIESDWTSASYFYSICALSRNSVIELCRFYKNSLQGDSILVQVFEKLGVRTEYTVNGIRISSQTSITNSFNFDCNDCPDLAQTIAVTCFGLGIECYLTGLSTLKIKETDRLVALKSELEKLGAQITVTADSIYLKKHSINLKTGFTPQSTIIQTYHDHRMALSFAALSMITNKLTIDDETVVEKSYPGFWRDLKSLGFNVNLQA